MINQSKKSFIKINLIITLLSVIISYLTIACNNQSQINSPEKQEIQTNQTNNNSPENPNQNLFSCQKNTEKIDQERWEVIYQKKDNSKATWLNLTKNNIKSDNLEKSCNQIAQTLDQLNQEGLFNINYQVDSNNKNSYLLCGETKSKPNQCSLITELKVTQNIDQTFKEIAQPLLIQSKTNQKVSGNTSEITNNINLAPHLLGGNNQ